MDIVEKENEILEKLKESGYSTLGGDKEKALNYLAEQMEKVLLYDKKAISEQIRSRVRGDSSEEQESLRREAEYERIASGLNALNEVCADLGLAPFADIDVGDMKTVEGFIGECRRDLYNRGIGKGHE